MHESHTRARSAAVRKPLLVVPLIVGAALLGILSALAIGLFIQA